MSGYALDEVPVKTALAADHRATHALHLPPHLRPLLVMIDGQRTVRELLSLGLRNVVATSFDELYEFGLIEGGSGSPTRFHHTMPTASIAAAAPKKGLSEIRFAVIDALLDVSTRDFAARPWVERMENARTVEQLMAEVQALRKTPLVAQHPGLEERLRKAFG